MDTDAAKGIASNGGVTGSQQQPQEPPLTMTYNEYAAMTRSIVLYIRGNEKEFQHGCKQSDIENFILKEKEDEIEDEDELNRESRTLQFGFSFFFFLHSL